MINSGYQRAMHLKTFLSRESLLASRNAGDRCFRSVHAKLHARPTVKPFIYTILDQRDMKGPEMYRSYCEVCANFVLSLNLLSVTGMV